MCLRMWAELPEDIVESISKKFTSYGDYVRYRCVCRRWRLSIPDAPLHLPAQQFPWLMISHQSLFDLSTNKIYDLNIAPYFSRRTHIYGSSHGWIVIIDTFLLVVRLLNPITLATISLPKWNPVDNITTVKKVVLSSSPLLSDDFAAFALLELNRFAVCKKGYDSWLVLKWGIVFDGMDAIYKNGSFFVVGTKGMIAVFDVDCRKISYIEMSCIKNSLINYGIRSELSPFALTSYGVLPCIWQKGIPFVTNLCNLVFLQENMLLVIPILIISCSGMTKTIGFKIYKMNLNVCKWEQIHSLGEHSLFIGTKSSSLSCVGCRPNCIYFTDYIDDTYGKYMGIYSLLNETIDLLPFNPHGSYYPSVFVETSPN